MYYSWPPILTQTFKYMAITFWSFIVLAALYVFTIEAMPPLETEKYPVVVDFYPENATYNPYDYTFEFQAKFTKQRACSPEEFVAYKVDRDGAQEVIPLLDEDPDKPGVFKPFGKISRPVGKSKTSRWQVILYPTVPDSFFIVAKHNCHMPWGLTTTILGPIDLKPYQKANPTP